jgi:hypothetical protein
MKNAYLYHRVVQEGILIPLKKDEKGILEHEHASLRGPENSTV